MQMGYIMFHLYNRIHLGIPDDRYIKTLWDASNHNQHIMWEYMADQYYEALKDHEFTTGSRRRN